MCRMSPVLYCDAGYHQKQLQKHYWFHRISSDVCMSNILMRRMSCEIKFSFVNFSLPLEFCHDQTHKQCCTFRCCPILNSRQDQAMQSLEGKKSWLYMDEKVNSDFPKSHKPTNQPTKEEFETQKYTLDWVFNQNIIVTSFILSITEKEVLSKKDIQGLRNSF